LLLVAGVTVLKIVADENIPSVQSLFSPLGEVTLVNGRELGPEQLQQADILLVRSVTRVNKALLADSPVRFVGTATIGTDHLDINYLQSQGIQWANAPGSNANSVVDYVISACCRLEGVLEGLLAGDTVGIIGMGNVGARLYQRLSALGIRCKAFDPLIDQQRYPVLTSLDEVLQAQVICCHAPLSKTGDYPSYHLLNQQRLEMLGEGAMLLNAGRGGVIDNQALLALLADRQDLCVVLDVWENEPRILLDLLKRVDLASPHIAGYSFDGRRNGAQMIFSACCQWLKQPAQLAVEPQDSALSLQITETDNVVAAMKEAVLACYDIGKDDQTFRGALLHSRSSIDADGAVAFDRLRKQYPQRREFSCYQISNVAALHVEVASGLRALGFRL
jgi:erythronate-4-phosphate dehydrogenase